MSQVSDGVRARTDGVRSFTGSVSVDSGTVAINTTRRSFKDISHGGRPEMIEGIFLCPSGDGDGTYDVLVLEEEAGDVLGVEVVFLSPTLWRRVEQTALERLGPPPSGAARRTLHAKTLPPADEQRIRAYETARHEIEDNVTVAELCRVRPGDDATAGVEVAGVLVLEQDTLVGVGDPFCEGLTTELLAPAGEYVAVAWYSDEGAFGRRVARMGLYAKAPAD